MKIKILLLLIGAYNLSTAQVSASSNKNIKLKSFWNFDVEKERTYPEFKSSSYISVAMELMSKEKRNFNEFELIKFKFYSNSGWEKNLSGMDLRLSYNYNFAIFKSFEKLKCFIGVGAEPYFVKISRDPLLSTDFNYGESDFGVDINMGPRCKFNLNDKLAFEAKVNLGMFNVNRSTVRYEKPTLPIADRRSSSTGFLIGGADRLYARASLGVNYQL
ncbi:MAG: hypothetical protein N4A35_08805 [Flavobacteriales bacterium]|jgi:hypothetical protein|nr:hypothetical protein [Flavobacteriales bacterium]